MTREDRKAQLLRNVDVLETVLDRTVNHPSRNAVDQTAKVLCCQYLMLEILDQVSEFPELKDSIMQAVDITRKMLYPNEY
ncbi:hypothetical protein HOU41_gp015 [Proteus phage Stubb]|uniref:Uncharacterized protein n=1 Tax=Proteus phage Stubb TaxID=2315597 RepID=A0A3B8E4R8_9CAUD|nr:hypothetical protein HOU41_gp015 [Proteus phage Stubb]AYJ73155.1 hypothetical protein CPT_Stubb_015 [Proteus phage Stubb]